MYSAHFHPFSPLLSPKPPTPKPNHTNHFQSSNLPPHTNPIPSFPQNSTHFPNGSTYNLDPSHQQSHTYPHLTEHIADYPKTKPA
ncbi:hypothetical protein BofuT4_uP029510.1 [Botrytis cinerea T4]|uniref:Uncharacterized protein n=1 Tax=Botryotinia fuckeliana (strain T4) TaxID=999810 RepID=G2Y8Z9_BOTF4|nr:hypothetical protein BofuT4_uP029510.1 [Botrytis cinerea T4]